VVRSVTRTQLRDIRETLTPADHATHRRYAFEVPAECREVHIWVRYAPKWLSSADAQRVARTALVEQTARLAARLRDDALAAQWSADHTHFVRNARVANLLTISLDDATGAYRGAGHRHADDQRLVLGPEAASPGLVSGPLPAGMWTLTLSAHTLVTPQCDVSIQIGAEIADSRPSASRSSA
jgi:hypothetical protein